MREGRLLPLPDKRTLHKVSKVVKCSLQLLPDWLQGSSIHESVITYSTQLAQLEGMLSFKALLDNC